MSDNEEVNKFDDTQEDFDRRHSTPYPEDNEEIKYNDINMLRKYCKNAILVCTRKLEKYSSEGDDREMYNFYCGVISAYRDVMERI